MALNDITGFSTYGITDAGSGLKGHDLVKRDLLNHFMTRLGERLGRPLFGCRIWDWVFEPMTPGLEMRCGDEAVRIAQADGRVDISSVSIGTFEYGIVVEMALVYRDDLTADAFRLSFDQRQEV
jgi:phage baseplate assembly protein W